jgi:hypothetical protein
MHVRLSSVALEHAVNDPLDRTIMPMSTLIDCPQFLFEASWDGERIGDVHIFKNENCNQAGQPLKDDDGKDLAPAWKWWNGVPCDKVKSYKLLDVSKMTPNTVEDAGMPFELGNVQRKEKSGQASEGKPARA